jgi:hypothetical protein
VLLAATVGALAVGIGAASAGWLGLSDTKYFRYDDPGHVCTDGIDFGVAHPFGPQPNLTVEVTRGVFDASHTFVPQQTIMPETTIGPLDTFDPSLDIGGTPGHWYEFFRLPWTSTPPVGSPIHIEFRIPLAGGGSSLAETFDEIEACTRLFFAGFFPPIDNGAFNRMKAGRAVPVKFGLGGDHAQRAMPVLHLAAGSQEASRLPHLRRLTRRRRIAQRARSPTLRRGRWHRERRSRSLARWQAQKAFRFRDRRC